VQVQEARTHAAHGAVVRAAAAVDRGDRVRDERAEHVAPHARGHGRRRPVVQQPREDVERGRRRREARQLRGVCVRRRRGEQQRDGREVRERGVVRDECREVRGAEQRDGVRGCGAGLQLGDVRV
jgi:hypothetical protein